MFDEPTSFDIDQKWICSMQQSQLSVSVVGKQEGRGAANSTTELGSNDVTAIYHRVAGLGRNLPCFFLLLKRP